MGTETRVSVNCRTGQRSNCLKTERDLLGQRRELRSKYKWRAGQEIWIYPQQRVKIITETKANGSDSHLQGPQL